MLSWRGVRPIALILVLAVVTAEAVSPVDPLRLAELGILGGSAEDAATGIAVGPSGEILVAGRTQSADFPVVAALLNACTQSAGRCGDGFLSKLNTLRNLGTGTPYSMKMMWFWPFHNRVKQQIHWQPSNWPNRKEHWYWVSAMLLGLPLPVPRTVVYIRTPDQKSV